MPSIAKRFESRSRRSSITADLRAVCARPDGQVIDLPGLSPVVDGGLVRHVRPGDFIPMPPGSLLLSLPDRSPLAADGTAKLAIDTAGDREVCAVGAALPLGYTRTLLPAYEERAGALALPLYGYTAVAWHADGFRVAALRTDELEDWDSSLHEPHKVSQAVEERKREYGANGLIRQLERCAVEYGCYTAQNIFLRRGEAAIPVSPACNARCIGCISAQDPGAGIVSAQQRIAATPSVADVSALAVAHLDGAKDGMISFGQGCEGEPLLAAPKIAAAIQAIRTQTSRGTIHCNTNASLPRALEVLVDAGLQSIRVSLNSARPDVYSAYYRPRGYNFDDVLESVKIADRRGVAISLNLLTHPGVTDDPREIEALARLLRAARISMVQTRTLNVDPRRYFAAVGRPRAQPLGIACWAAWLQTEFPHVRLGNFTRGFG
ncbi:MAG: radical SAM protein [Candidatus Eremiobacteraeota bacterium]|nr:radical SAM protein [Candidatus Eremiobacteraeota bacterium]